jgi:N-acetylgalactosamine kinase
MCDVWWWVQGSRLTGAGWGGCAISLVAVPATDTTGQTLRHFFAQLQAAYYDHIPRAKTMAQSDYMFATTPGDGAGLFVPPSAAAAPSATK